MFQNRLPSTADFDTLSTVKSDMHVTIKIEARRVRFTAAAHLTPLSANAWRYVRAGGKEDNDHVLAVPFGPILNVRRDAKLCVTYQNKLGHMAPMENPSWGPTLEMPPINPLPMSLQVPNWQTMNPSVGIVTHLHGAVVEATSDGWPLKPASFTGNPYHFATELHYEYTNHQRSGMLWFHDHAMDNTAVQVHAGLAGVYFIRDDADDKILALVGGNEIPLVIQDRKIRCDFTGVDYWAGIPTFPTDWDRSEHLGDTILVNGRPWPFVEVERKVYRLRVLNGSNARTYALALVDPAPWNYPDASDFSQVFYTNLLRVIGNDGGLFPASRPLLATDTILLAPAERLDLLLDLTSLQTRKDEMGMDVPMQELRLVNLAVTSAQAGDWPEAIFQTEEKMDFPPPIKAVASSVLHPPAPTDHDLARVALGWIAALRSANVMQFCVDMMKPAGAPLDIGAVDAALGAVASEDGFSWSGGALGLPAAATVAKNRLVLLMNNTSGLATDDGTQNVYAATPWRDTQIWEMSTTDPGDGKQPFQIPFDVDLTSDNPNAGAPSATAQNYFVVRSSFFTTYPTPRRIDIPDTTKTPSMAYADVSTRAFTPKAGTYERWYVANLGNQQPLSAGAGGDVNTAPGVPDMHPFHMHLVNFVVTNRWRLDSIAPVGGFSVVSRINDFDNVCRHDTVRVQSNELLELLVYFPSGYKGTYPFHCHIVEHEDMGMMSHFVVS